MTTVTAEFYADDAVNTELGAYVPTYQWLNRKEWCLGSGRRRQLS
jgi:hypothetical protein